MNISKKQILIKLKEKPFVNQRVLSEQTGLSLGKVNQSIRELQCDGFLNQEMHLTRIAQEAFEQNAPRNAIILAAGYGMRMFPINTEISKGMIQVYGEVLIERTIEQLREAGVREIFVVVGFMKEEYEYLIDKYEVKLIVNSKYADKNNLHSLALVSDKIENTYIVPCDIWCRTNPYSDHELYSWYMVTEAFDDESTVRVNRMQELVKTADGGNKMIGIAYIAKDEAQIVRARLRVFNQEARYDSCFWEEVLFEKNKMITMAQVVSSYDTYEINTFEQLKELDSDSRQLKPGIITLIADTLHVAQNEIEDITVLKKGMTNRSFQFCCQGKKYIMRIPGEGTEQLINRRQEYNVYKVIHLLHICDDIYYMNPENGYKITAFLENARVCDPLEPVDVQKCMWRLREFHELTLKVDHTFDIFRQIEFYESLWEGRPSCYRDYEETKKKVYELKKFIDEQPKKWTLTHIDAVPDNFMLVSKENGETEIRLIDWEYAGMQDPHVDIAMFAIYAMYDHAQVEQLIDAYFPEGCSKEVRLKIYCYIAACGLLWSNWCEYKRQLGVEFGEYSLRQYRYAKEYYRYFKNEEEQEKWQ